jgi:hypothetical protein
MPNVWTIHHGDVTGGPTKSDLHGFHIQENDDSTAYLFVKGNDTYATATNNGTLPTTPFSFVGFGLDSYTWTVTVTTLTGGASGNQAQGTWTNNAPNPADEQDGTFTAQAGSGVEGDECGDREDDTAAASA